MLALASRTASRALLATATTRDPPGPPVAGWATLARVDLPHERAKVKVEMRSSLATTPRAVASASARMRDRLSLVDVRYSAHARTFAAALDALVQARASTCADSPDACLASLDGDLRRAYDAACPCPDEDRKAVQLVDLRFRTMLLEVEGQELRAELTIQNAPLRRSSFGLATGVSFGRTSAHPNVKIDRGVYAHDALDRQLVMVTWNRAFAAYDDKAARITHAERHRWFVGAVVTPTFGIGAGYSYLPIRGFGLNAGYAVLGTSRPAAGKTIGDEPANRDDPFAFGWAGTWLAGVSYNFK
jgi:hypothetical protein